MPPGTADRPQMLAEEMEDVRLARALTRASCAAPA